MIIADLSTNWYGDMDLAKELVLLAKQNGAWAVKGQLYSTDGLERTPETLKELKKCEMTFVQARELFEYGQKLDIEVFYSVFDASRVEWCEVMSTRRYKIAARMLDKKVINAIAKTKKPVIASISPRYPRQVGWADSFYNIDFLYCPSGYPDSEESVHLSNIDFYAFYSGYSDHFLNIDICQIVISRGARIIEKHFAIDKSTGLDARWSMTPLELRILSEWELIVKKVQ